MNDARAVKHHAPAWGFKPRHLVIIVVFIAIFFPTLYFLATQSEAFGAAEQFARTSPDVSKRVGNVSGVELRFFDGFHVTGDESGFVMDVKGGKGDAIVDVRLRRAANIWRVEQAYITTKSEKGVSIVSAGMTIDGVRVD